MRVESDHDAGDGEVSDVLAEWMELEGQRHLTWIAEDGTVPIGMIWLALLPRVPRPHLRDRWSGDIQTFWIRPDHRRRGLGRRMLDEIVDEADRRGLERVVVHSSEGAVSIYESVGFTPYSLLLNRRRPE
ncbi:MAG: GNAT family N-acetyltransferase [Gordonia polyisoprenivorans]|nr:GNAT family N-acetyltransferase [Gordonia polyisoprenivorans]